MEAMFTKLVRDGKNNVEGLIQWLKNAKLVETTEKDENHARSLFTTPTEEELEEFEKFKRAAEQLAEEHDKSFEEISKILAEEGPKLIATLRAGLKAYESSSSDDLSSTKLVESTKEGEDKARSLFAGIDEKNVEMEKFKEVVQKLANEQHKSFEQFSKQLADEGPKLLQSAMAGVAALKDQFMK